jgi:hypothetical protein
MSLILDGTNGLSDVDGSAATPAIRGSDANTGVFFDSDVVGLSTDGTERVRVDASGNVGIGTSSPQTPLQIAGGTDNANVQDYITLSRTAYPTANFRQVIASSSGSVASQNTIVFKTSDGTSAAAERVRIDGSGNLLVGKTSNDFSTAGAIIRADGDTLLTRAGTVLTVRRNATNGTAVDFRRDATTVGTISVTTTNTAYNTSSDYRLKHDIQPMTDALAKVAALKPVTYKWNADDSQSQGFIAHELQEVVPECVTGEKDAVDADGNPQYQGIDTSFLVATLTAAIQEQQAIITALTARVEALEGAQA